MTTNAAAWQMVEAKLAALVSSSAGDEAQLLNYPVEGKVVVELKAIELTPKAHGEAWRPTWAAWASSSDFASSVCAAS
jgi:hypothetical protein